MAFKDRLRDEIEYKGMLIKELSAAVGISNSTFLSYIDARGTLPNVETAVKIAKTLGVSVEYLVTGTDSINNQQNEEIKYIIRDLQTLDLKQIEIIKKMIHALTT